MPITTGPSPHTIYSIPPSPTPEIRHLKPKQFAEEAKQSVQSLGEELKSLDNSPQDLWSGTGQVMVHEMDYHRGFFQRLFGCGEKITAIANFENGQLKKLDAAVYDAGHTVNGAENRNFKYEKHQDGTQTFVAPRNVNRWSEMVETGRRRFRVTTARLSTSASTTRRFKNQRTERLWWTWSPRFTPTRACVVTDP